MTIIIEKLKTPPASAVYDLCVAASFCAVRTRGSSIMNGWSKRAPDATMRITSERISILPHRMRSSAVEQKYVTISHRGCGRRWSCDRLDCTIAFASDENFSKPVQTTTATSIVHKCTHTQTNTHAHAANCELRRTQSNYYYCRDAAKYPLLLMKYFIIAVCV